MKKKYLLFAAFAGITSLTLSSYSNGPIAGGAGNRTGSAGSQANCSVSGCHAANSAATVINIILQDPTSPLTPVTAYVPGRTYTVVFGASNSAAGLSRFGFQFSAVRSAATSTQAGTFAVGSTADIIARTVSGLSIIEHTTPIAATNPGLYGVTFSWTAPAAGTGTVKFFGIANVVNFNGTVSGDAPNAGSKELPESTVGVQQVKQTLAIKAYPSPVTQTLQLEISDAGTKAYTAGIFDVTGRKVQQTTISGDKVSLDVSSLVSGHYIMYVIGEQAQGSIRFVKQ